jgi:hypothetical protein
VVNPTSKRPETATAYTGERWPKIAGGIMQTAFPEYKAVPLSRQGISNNVLGEFLVMNNVCALDPAPSAI